MSSSLTNNAPAIFSYDSAEGTLFISVAGLVSAGISESTIKNGLSDNRKTYPSLEDRKRTWHHKKDNHDKRSVWVLTSTLPPMTLQRVEKHYGNLSYAFRAHTLYNKVTAMKHDDDITYFEDLAIRRNGQGFDRFRIIQLAQACAWLRSIADTDFWKPIWRFKANFYHECITLLNDEKLFCLNITNERVLDRKLEDFRRDGRISLVSGRFGKPSNYTKLQGDGFNHIIAEYAKPTKMSIKYVTLYYNALAKQNDWQPLSEARIGQILKANEPLWYESRNEKTETIQEIRPTIKTLRALAANGLWEFDGTALQLLFLDERTGKISSSLYIIYIIDQHSERIMGYAVTKKAKESESTQLVSNAFSRAFADNAYHRPRQLKYDNSSANISHAAKAFMTGICNAHFPVEPYNAGAKTIESTIGRIEALMQEMFANFKGGNITGKGLDRKANQEHIANLAKHGLLPMQEEIYEQAEQLVRTWNNRPAKRDSKTPNQRYYESLEASKDIQKKLTERTVRDLFWLEWKHQHKYSRDGIMVQFSPYENPTYYVVQKDGLEDMAFRDQYFTQKFTLKYDPRNLEQVALYQNEQFVAMATKKQEYHHAIEDKAQGEHEQLIKELNNRKQYLDNKSAELRAIQEEVAIDAHEVPSLYNLNQAQYKAQMQELEDLQFANMAVPAPSQDKAEKHLGLYASTHNLPIEEVD